MSKGWSLEAFDTARNGSSTVDEAEHSSPWCRVQITLVFPMAAAETESVTFSIGNLRLHHGRGTIGLLDAEFSIAGVTFTIHGIRVSITAERTTIRLPAYRDPEGAWKDALSVPPEISAALSDAILAFLVEQGVARNRYDGAPA